MSLPVVLATGGYDHKIRLWDATSGTCLKTIVFGESQVNCLHITADKTLLLGGGNPHMNMFDIHSSEEKPIASYEGHTNNITSVGCQKHLKWLYSTSEDGTIRIWDPRSSTATRIFDNTAPVTTSALSPNQAELITGDQNGYVKVWDLVADKCRQEIQPLPDVAVRSIGMASDASLITVGSHRGKVFVFAPTESKNLELVHEFTAHDQYLLKCVLSPDVNSLVTTSADKSIRLWNTSNWSLTRSLTQHQKWVWDAVFSADSMYLVSVSSDMSGKLWDLRSGSVIKTYTGHNLAVTCVALNDNH